MPRIVIFYCRNDCLYKFQENKKVPVFGVKEKVQQLEILNPPTPKHTSSHMQWSAQQFFLLIGKQYLKITQRLGNLHSRTLVVTSDVPPNTQTFLFQVKAGKRKFLSINLTNYTKICNPIYILNICY